MALLAPPDNWEPVRVAVRSPRSFPARRALSMAAAAPGIVCMLAVAIPLTRVFASQAGVSWHAVDQLWYWLPLIHNPQLVRLGRLPEEMRSIGTHPLTTPGSPQQVSGIADASQRAGFMPRMPDSSAMPGTPRLSVVGAASFGRSFNTAELESALRQAGVTDQTVASTWEQAWVGVQVGPRVVAEWSDVAEPGTGAIRWSRMTLMQSAPPVFQLPPGIDLTSFAALNLRATLMSANTARQFAQEAVPAAALLIDKGTLKSAGWESAITVRYVSLRRGPAVLAETMANPGHNQQWAGGPPIERLLLLWGEADRVYVLAGDLDVPLGMVSYDLAGAVASMVEIADGIK